MEIDSDVYGVQICHSWSGVNQATLRLSKDVFNVFWVRNMSIFIWLVLRLLLSSILCSEKYFTTIIQDQCHARIGHFRVQVDNG